MSFEDLPRQPAMFPAADDYARACLRLSREAARECDIAADIAHCDDYWQKIGEWCGFMAPATVAMPAIFADEQGMAP